MTVELTEALNRELRDRTWSRAWGEGHLVASPLDLRSGQTAVIYVEQIAEDVIFLSDRGMTADALGDEGVDIHTRSIRRHWDALRLSLDLETPAMREVSDYELAGTVSSDRLGSGMLRLTEGILRGDALRILGRAKPVTFSERAMRRAHEHELTVVARPKFPNRFKAERAVSFSAASEARMALVQTIGSADVSASVDHARAVLGDLPADIGERVSLVSDAARLEGWQNRALGEVSLIVSESQQDPFWESLKQPA